MGVPRPLSWYLSHNLKSKYHPFSSMFSEASKALEPTEPIPSPGGTPKHFWLLLKHTSIPHSSTLISTPPMLLTASTKTRTPKSLQTLVNAGRSLRSPVLVSLWVMATASTSGSSSRASSKSSGRVGAPSSDSSTTTSRPLALPTSANLLPKLPLTHTSILSRTQFLTQASMKPDPVLLNRNTGLSVPRNSWSFLTTS